MDGAKSWRSPEHSAHGMPLRIRGRTHQRLVLSVAARSILDGRDLNRLVELWTVIDIRPAQRLRAQQAHPDLSAKRALR